MGSVTVRDLRNHSAAMLARVAHGERVTVTRDGLPVAEVIPLPRVPLNSEQLVEQFSRLPKIDAAEFTRDINEVLDAAP